MPITTYTNSIIDNIVAAGPVATTNLFSVTFIFPNQADNDQLTIQKLPFQVVTFTTPERKAATIDIPYKSTYYKIATPGHTALSKSQTITIRVDENFKNYNFLQQNNCINEDGNFVKDPSKQCSIEVVAFDPNTSSKRLSTVYKWTFNNCYITGIDTLSFNYDSVSTLSAPVTFIYKNFKEESLL